MCLFVDELEKMFRECETHMVFTEKTLTDKIKELDLELVSCTSYTCSWVVRYMVFAEKALTDKIKELDLELVSCTSYTCSWVVRCFVSVRHIWCSPRRR